jgi:hypothetical protein
MGGIAAGLGWDGACWYLEPGEIEDDRGQGGQAVAGEGKHREVRQLVEARRQRGELVVAQQQPAASN